MTNRSTEFLGSETILYDSIMVDTSHYVFVKTHRMECKTHRVNPSVNCGLSVIMMGRCKFHKCTMLVQGVHSRGNWGEELGNSSFLSHFSKSLKLLRERTIN